MAIHENHVACFGESSEKIEKMLYTGPRIDEELQFGCSIEECFGRSPPNYDVSCRGTLEEFVVTCFRWKDEMNLMLIL
jgi:hypothetical protein